jgi:hypothetical protein
MIHALRCLLILLVVATNAYAAPILEENFDDVTTLPGKGWVQTNNSSPLGSTGWFQGNPGIFPAQAGGPDSYIAANFNNADFGGNISNWLLTPTLTVNNSDILTFFTRSANGFPDRLEVRFSSNGSSSSVGATDSSVGDFINLLLTINPSLDPAGYPPEWTMFQVSMSDLPGPTSGRYGFRYSVPDTNTYADYIGIDTVSVNSSSVPEPSTFVCMGIGMACFAYWRRRQVRRR